MAKRTFGGQEWAPEQQPCYQLNGRLKSFYQHIADERREFLASRNALHLDRFRAELGRTRRAELRSEQMGYEGND